MYCRVLQYVNLVRQPRFDGYRCIFSVVLQCVLQCVAVCCGVLSVLQCVAVCCNVLQCVAVCQSFAPTPITLAYSINGPYLPFHGSYIP